MGLPKICITFTKKSLFKCNCLFKFHGLMLKNIVNLSDITIHQSVGMVAMEVNQSRLDLPDEPH